MASGEQHEAPRDGNHKNTPGLGEQIQGFLGCHECLLAEDSLCNYGIMEVLPSFQASEKGPAGSLTLLFWSFKFNEGSEYLGCLCMDMYSEGLYEILHRWWKMQFHFPGDVPNSFQLIRKPAREEGDLCI